MGVILIVVVVLIFSIASAAMAQSAATQPSAAAASGVGTAHPIHRGESSTSAGERSADGASGWQVALSLAAVLLLIIGLYWVSRRVLPGGGFGSTAGSRAIQILARAPLGPKHRVMLLQIGRRIVVIADTAGQPLTTLCQITDPDEAAALIGQLGPGGADSRGAMAAFLEKATVAANPAPSQPVAQGADLAATKQELDGLLQQVRSMSQQIGRAS